ncbi:MAG: putative hydroxymethylpyrimidine transporter CytX [Ruminococcaceae bacterium]|nr:putative hydroxymethylpyrimidine transporter CytX [Oscillospiraceae bacterium]
MAEKKTSVYENGLIWFGAGVSLAEILTGTYFAPLGFQKGLAAVLLGHVVGCALLFLAGMIGARTGKSAMETVKLSFGRKGALLFAALNVLQLVGWTAIMIYDGALAAEGVLAAGRWVWCLVIGALILVWILVGVQNLGRLNTVAMAALFCLTLVLSAVIFRGGAAGAADDSLSFGAAVELSVAMPLSWLPLISDYTRSAKRPTAATAVSAVVYGLVSCWMYVIGMGAAIFAGESDLAQIILRAGLGAAGLLVIVLSTVTTTFLDAWSAGISSESLSARLPGKWVAVATAAVGTLGAMLFPMDDITGFLYLIGSVFAPMVAIQIADFFLLRRSRADVDFDVRDLVIWALGFIAYRLLMRVDLPVGSTLPDMAFTMALCLAAHAAAKKPSRTA